MSFSPGYKEDWGNIARAQKTARLKSVSAFYAGLQRNNLMKINPVLPGQMR
ncbi:MAG: hypothetical protein Q8J75_07430 [Rhodocyclaceae bacterium]|nr:hypothetical protein [Rhodocyclaceae bacterium]